MLGATRAEAERLLGIAEKLLETRDLNGSREFAILAQETEPLLEGSDQILAIVDVLIASDKRVNNHPDWYAILQVDRRSGDLDVIKRNYRRLALLLHPDKSRFHYADHAFKLVADAWAVLSDPHKKGQYDKELNFFSRVDLSVPGWVQQEKLPVRRTGPGPGPGPNQGFQNQGFETRSRGSGSNRATGASAVRNEIHAEENSRARSATASFWTACPYCYRLYEYPRVYEGCCLRCQNCERSFHAILIPNLPPLVPGQEAYHCCWGFFPMGFVLGNLDSAEKELPVAAAPPEEQPPPPPQPASVLPNWMPAPASHAAAQTVQNGGNSALPAVTPTRVTRSSAVNGVAPATGTVKRKRGRPRKYPLRT